MTGIGVAGLRGFISVWLAVTVAFILLRVLPGDAIQAQAMQAGMADSIIEERRQSLGLDRPLVEQYATYLGKAMQADLGVSLVTGERVGQMLMSRGAETLRLAFGALVLSIAIGMMLGTAGGLSHHSVTGQLCRWTIDLLIAVPIYVSGTLAVMSGVLTGGFGAAVVLGLHSAAPIANTLSIALLSENQQGYVWVAYSKGLPEWLILWRHRVRVVLPMLVPVISVQVGFLLGGTVITETIFSRAGLGQSLLDGVMRRDYPVVQGWVLLMAACQAVIYGLTQIAGRWLDPRQREKMA